MPYSAILATIFTMTVGGTRAVPTPVCMPADSTSAFMISSAKALMSSTPAGLVAERQSLQVPLVSPDTIVLINDESVCSQMATAFAGSLQGGDTPSGQVYVVQVGSVYIVRDPTIMRGEFALTMVVNSQRTVLAKFKG